jgi:hypothetical protein
LVKPQTVLSFHKESLHGTDKIVEQLPMKGTGTFDYQSVYENKTCPEIRTFL